MKTLACQIIINHKWMPYTIVADNVVGFQGNGQYTYVTMNDGNTYMANIAVSAFDAWMQS